jgi:hypothetical protein
VELIFSVITVHRLDDLAKPAIDALHLKREKRFRPKLFTAGCAKIAAMVAPTPACQPPGERRQY